MEQESAAFTFEGDEVTDFTAQLPSAKLEAPEAYPRGTYLTLQVEVRVKSVRLEEDRHGNLTRHHVLALESCAITETLTPAQRRELIEAAEKAAQEVDLASQSPEIDEEPGPDAAYADAESDAPREVIRTGYLAIDTEPPAHDEGDDDDAHAWMDEDDDEPGALHVEFVEREAQSRPYAVAGF
jgi:hypothetical protein